MTRSSEPTQEPVPTPPPASQVNATKASPTPQPRKRKGPRQKHVPVRTCVACRTADAKRSYVRLVRTPDGRVEIDPTGRRNGRGAYLCRTRACWNRAADGQQLDRALNVQVDAETRATLREYARTHFPPDGVASGVVTVTITADELEALSAQEQAQEPSPGGDAQARGQPPGPDAGSDAGEASSSPSDTATPSRTQSQPKE